VGTAIVTYRVSPTVYNVAVIYVNPLPVAISGSNTICNEAYTFYTGTPGSSATWSSSDVSVATISYATGLATAVAEGTTTITYKVPTTGCFTTKVVTVIPAPAVITGPSTICTGESATLESSPSGGAWSASNTVASVDAATGVVTGNMGGGVTIMYTALNGCRRTKALTVNAVPANIMGTTTITAGSITTLSSATTGGTWSSSNTTVAIPATTAGITSGTTTSKIVNGLSGGTATIYYTLSNGCSKSAEVTVVAGRPGAIPTDYTDVVTGFRMYPNPTNGLLTIEAQSAGTLALFTFDGKLVQEFKLEAMANSITIPSTLAAGVYICQFRFDDGTSRTEKLMYQN
jgi:trimeric autotransporter adhesin